MRLAPIRTAVSVATAVAAAAAIVLSSASPPARAAGADPALLAAATAAQPAVVQTLKEMVAIESGSSNAEGLARMADYTSQRLQALGGRVERLQPARGQAPIVKASFTGNGSRRVLLIAHMDTVYPAGTLATQPIREDGNRLYGPGIADDKGGIAVILHCARHPAQAARLARFRGAHRAVQRRRGDRLDRLGRAHRRRGRPRTTWCCRASRPPPRRWPRPRRCCSAPAAPPPRRWRCKGRSSHAGAAPAQGRNALVELSHRIVQTRDVAKGVPGTQLNWTMAQAGSVRNQIPERATATADVRLTAKDGAERLRRRCRGRSRPPARWCPTRRRR